MYKAVCFNRVRTLVLTGLLGVVGIIASAFAANAASVNLAWDPSTSTGVLGYNIYYGTSSGGYTTTASVTNATTITIPSLVAGTTYYFAATAFDDTGLES